MTSTRPAILVEGLALTKRFEVGRRLPFAQRLYLNAVVDVTIRIPAGETLGLVGESGSGKSTLGRMLLGATPPTTGAIRFGEESITNPPPHEWRALRHRMQLVQQNPGAALDPHMTIGQQLTEALDIRNVAPRKDRPALAAEMLNRVGLSPSLAMQFPHELSGGQQQRIAIARALLMEPTFVVCDEPVSALDLSVQAQVLNLLKDLQNTLNLTYLFISHDLNVVRYMSHQIAVMYLGRIVEMGRTGDVLREPKHPYTRALLASSPIPDPLAGPLVAQVTGEPPDPLFPPAGCRFHPRCHYATELCRQVPPEFADSDSLDHHVSCHHPFTGALVAGASA